MSRARAFVTSLAACVLAAGPVGPPAARAFERETVDGYPDRPLFWSTRRIPIRPAYGSSLDVPEAGLRAAIPPAFETWERAGGGCTDIQLEDAGPPAAFDTNITGGAPDRENRIVFRESSWPDGVSRGVLALTTSVYVVRTGELIDSDIDLNGVDFFWSATDEPGRIVNDVQNTITHELGHLLGFAHVSDPEATMYGSSPEGELIKRDLSPDDIDAVCTIYPTGGRPPELGRRGSGLVGVSSCAVSPPGGGRAPALALVGLLVAAALRRAARRRARPARA